MLPIGLLCGLSSVASADEVPPTPRGCDGGVRRGLARPLVGGGGVVALASDARPLLIWYGADHEHSASLAPAVLAAIEEAWAHQVDTLGFAAPILPDATAGPELDIYLIPYEPWSAYVAADSYTDAIPGDGLNSTSAYMVIDRDLPIEAVPSYAAHEFNHVVQFATDFSEPTLPIWEGTATAAQSWTFGAAGRWDYDVPSFQEVPHYPVLTGDSYRVYAETGLGWSYEYGAALWVVFLDEHYGTGDGTRGVDLWAAAANEGLGFEPDVVDAFAAVPGLPLGTVMSELAVVRFVTGEDWDAGGLADAADWGDAEAVPADPLTPDELPFTGAPSAPPMTLGQAFFDLDLSVDPPAANQVIVVSASSASGLGTGLSVMWWTDDGARHHQIDIYESHEIQIPTDGVFRVAVGLTNLGPPGWDGDADPYVPGDHVVSIDVQPEPPPPPGTTDTGGPGPGPIDPGADPGVLGGSSACGCGAGTAGGANLGWIAAALAAARRRRSRR